MIFLGFAPELYWQASNGASENVGDVILMAPHCFKIVSDQSQSRAPCLLTSHVPLEREKSQRALYLTRTHNSMDNFSAGKRSDPYHRLSS